MILNIIHIPTRTDRWELLQKELQEQNISNYNVWHGIIDPIFKFQGISQAHKQVVKFAKENNLAEVLIAEDDLHFTAPNAFQYFLNNKPTDYDIYLSSVYYGKINNDNIVDDFAGLTFYIVNEKFYDIYLSISEQMHLDRALKSKGKFVVCNPFTVIQHNGFSDNKMEYCNYESYLKKRDLFV